MGTYEDLIVNKTELKRVPFQIILSGEELDGGKGTIHTASMLRDSEKDVTEVTDEEGNVVETIETNKYIKGSNQKHTVDIEKVLADTFQEGQITGAELFACIAEAVDNIYIGKYE